MKLYVLIRVYLYCRGSPAFYYVITLIYVRITGNIPGEVEPSRQQYCVHS